MKLKAKLFASALVLGLSLPGLAVAQGAQPPEWAKTVEAAKKEARVVIYTNMAPAVGERLKRDFEQAFSGMVIEIQRLPGMGVYVKLDQERKAKAIEADVAVYTEAVWTADRARENFFQVPSGPASAAWPKPYLIAGVAPVLSVEPFIMLYNTQHVKAPVTGYRDLLRPEFKAKLGVNVPASNITIGFYDFLEKTQGADFLARLAAQQPRFYTSAVPMSQAVAAGEILAGSFSVATISQPMVEQGAPMKIVVPSPALGSFFLGAALRDSKRPHAAQVFLDYVMSVRGQTVWNGRGESASPLPGIPGALDAKTIKMFDPTPYTPEVMKAYLEKWNRIFRGS